MMKRWIAALAAFFFSIAIIVIFDLGYLVVIMAWAITCLVVAAVLVGILALFVAAVYWGWATFERLLKIRAERLEVERKASLQITVVPRGNYCVASERNGAFSHRILVEGMGQELFQIASGSLLENSEKKPELLPALDTVQRCLIVGASDTGKTTLLQKLVARRLRSSKVIVIDPHSFPSKWAGGGLIVGQGRNYQKIDEALDMLVQLMVKRYDEIGKGAVAEMSHERITIIIDEWRAIVHNLGKPASSAIRALLTESRKAAFSVFVATHSDRAKPLGLEGEYDLKDGFTIVRLAFVGGVRCATLDNGNGVIPVELPSINENDKKIMQMY